MLGLGKDKEKNKKSIQGDLGDLLGAINPELQNFADLIASFVPANSFLRTQDMDRLWGILSDTVERRAEDLPFPWNRIVEKGSDLIEFLSRSLKEGKRISFAISRLNWQENFFNKAQERLANAQDVAAEAKKIEAEFIALSALMESLKQRYAAADPSTTAQGKTFKEEFAEAVGMAKKLDAKIGNIFKDMWK